MSEQSTAPRPPMNGRKTKKTGGGISWRLPLLYALPFALLALAASLIWGGEIRSLIQIVVKLVVKA